MSSEIVDVIGATSGGKKPMVAGDGVVGVGIGVVGVGVVGGSMEKPVETEDEVVVTSCTSSPTEVQVKRPLDLGALICVSPSPSG